jgi:hypothetical protein
MRETREKTAENSHFLRPYTAWFSVWRCLCGFRQMAAKSRRKQCQRKLTSHTVAIGSAERSVSAPASMAKTFRHEMIGGQVRPGGWLSARYHQYPIVKRLPMNRRRSASSTAAPIKLAPTTLPNRTAPPQRHTLLGRSLSSQRYRRNGESTR